MIEALPIVLRLRLRRRNTVRLAARTVPYRNRIQYSQYGTV
jgi:hypothetical protein